MTALQKAMIEDVVLAIRGSFNSSEVIERLEGKHIDPVSVPDLWSNVIGVLGEMRSAGIIRFDPHGYIVAQETFPK